MKVDKAREVKLEVDGEFKVTTFYSQASTFTAETGKFGDKALQLIAVTASHSEELI